MIKLGQYNTLRITRFTDHGAYLDGGAVGEILMPKTYVERSMRPGDEVEVFLYTKRTDCPLKRNPLPHNHTTR